MSKVIGSKVLDTLAQVVTELGKQGVEPWKVKLAKKLGAFRTGGRANPQEVLDFIAAHPEQFEKPPSLTKEEADIKLKEVKIARETLALERDRGHLVKKSDVDETFALVGQIQSSVTRQKFIHELPYKQAGLGVPEILAMNQAACDEIDRILHDRQGVWQSTSKL